MTLRQLRVFKEVYELKSVSLAAEKLYVSQPAVSVAISELEKEYGLNLFLRVNKRIIPTEDGKKFYENACKVLNAFSSFEKFAENMTQSPEMKIIASLTVGTYILPKLLNKIKAEFPSLRLTAKIIPTQKATDAVLRGEADFALVESFLFPDGISAEKFYSDKLVAVCARDFKAPDTLTPPDLKNVPLIVREAGSASRDLFELYLKQNNVFIKPYVETVNPQAAIQCCLSGCGVTVLPYGLVKEYLDDKRLKLIKLKGADFSRTYNIIKHKDVVFSPLQQSVYFLCRNFESLQ